MADPQVSLQAGNTYFSDPKFVQQLLGMLMGSKKQPGQEAQFTNFLSNPAGSELFQGQLGGLLQALVPSENAAVTNLSDMFRGAGNTSSSVFGGAAQGLQSDILRNRQELASKLLGQSFQQITQALLGQMGLTPELINATKLQSSQGATGPEGTVALGGTPGGTGTSGGGGGFSAGGGGAAGVPTAGIAAPYYEQPYRPSLGYNSSALVNGPGVDTTL
jgi:hypothetical protein